MFSMGKHKSSPSISDQRSVQPSVES